MSIHRRHFPGNDVNLIATQNNKQIFGVFWGIDLQGSGDIKH